MQTDPSHIDLATSLDEAMRRWPATIRVLLDLKTSCVGCPIAPFHTVEDACREHALDRVAVLAALRKIARQDESF